MNARFLIPVLVFFCMSIAAKEVEEKFPDGSVKLKYYVDKKGRKHGRYTEYNQKGEKIVIAQYKRGKLSGKYQKNIPEKGIKIITGYVNGIVHGSYFIQRGKQVESVLKWSNGKLNTINDITAYPKSVDEMLILVNFMQTIGTDKEIPDFLQDPALMKKLKNDLKKWDPGDLGDDGQQDDRLFSLQRLIQYRYLCGAPWRDTILDAEMNRCATAGAELCKAIGRLDHKPAKPAGWSQEDYDVAYKGTSHSNLAMMQNGLKGAVDGWMFDSDPSNIAALGHRMWCLNPRLLKTGFGGAGKFAGMWSMDCSRATSSNEYITYPGKGYMPFELFSKKHAWSISGPKVNAPGGNYSVSVSPLDEDWIKGDPLQIVHKSYGKGYGKTNALIFLPKDPDLSHGSRYWVEVFYGGNKAKGKKPDIQYMVEFISFNKMENEKKAGKSKG